MGNEVMKLEVGMDLMDLNSFIGEGPSGFEGIDSECISIPWLKIAQGTTDEVKRGTPTYLEGLQMGDFFVPSTRKVIGQEAKLVILKFYRSYSVYAGESTDSKFLGNMSPADYDAKIAPIARRGITKDGTEASYTIDLNGRRYVDNRNFIVLDYNDIASGPMIFSMSSTGIKPSKNWLTMAQNIHVSRDGVFVKAPMWVAVWRLKVGTQENRGYTSYQVQSIEQSGFVHPSVAETIKAAFMDAQAISASRILSDEPTVKVENYSSQNSEAVSAVNGIFGPRPGNIPAKTAKTEDEGFF